MSLSRRRWLATAAAGGLAIGNTQTGLAQPTITMGGALYQLVAGYCLWPHHRTGTPEGGATVDWFEGQLKARDAATSRWSYTYERYDWRASVTVNGQPIESLPLYYEGVGEIATDAPFVRPVTLADNFDKSDLEQALAEAAGSGLRLSVLLTFGRFGDTPPRPALIGINAAPGRQASGIPTLLVSGIHLDSMASGTVTATISAKRASARDVNVMGRLGSGSGSPLVVTTPLTGWFTCAGERGTGIAVALELAHALASEMPVVVIGTTGHELENLGIRQQLAAGLEFTPRAVVHIGASLAAGWYPPRSPILQLSPGRLASANRPIDGDSRLAAAVQAGSFRAAPRFLGEAEDWARHLPATTPLLSFAGSFPLFHTPQDTAEAATTPAMLQTVFISVRDAVMALLA